MITDEELYEDMLKHDLVVKMPPKRTYTVTVRIMSIKKAAPKLNQERAPVL